MNKGRFFAVGVGAGDPLDILLLNAEVIYNGLFCWCRCR